MWYDHGVGRDVEAASGIEEGRSHVVYGVEQLPEEVVPDFTRSFVVSVSTPVVVGSGYTRYTQYVISTKVRNATPTHTRIHLCPLVGLTHLLCLGGTVSWTDEQPALPVRVGAGEAPL